MTITAVSSRDQYTGAATPITGPFAYNFKVFDSAQIKVTQTDTAGAETVLTLTTDYTLTGIGAAGGGVLTLETALPTSELLTIQRINDGLQPEKARTSGSYTPETHEKAWDRLAMMMLQIEDILHTIDPANARAPILSVGDVVGTGAFDALSNRIKNLDDPTADQDAATKIHVAGIFSGIVGVIGGPYTTAGRPAVGVSGPHKMIYVLDGTGPGKYQVAIEDFAGTWSWVDLISGAPF